MRRLLDFLIKHNHWLVFVLLEAVCMIMLFNSNAYQSSVVFTSANEVTGLVLDAGSEVNDYLSLRETNKILMQRNTRLEQRVAYLEKALRQRITSRTI